MPGRWRERSTPADLRSVVHAPGDLLAGEPAADRALAGTASYAAECGAEQVVYHAQMVVDGRAAQDRLLAETRSLSVLARTAERLGVMLALENLAPAYPGPETVSANPLAVRALARRLASPAVGLCLDVGHANVIAGLRRTSLHRMVAPVLDMVLPLPRSRQPRCAMARRRASVPTSTRCASTCTSLPGEGTINWFQAGALLRRPRGSVAPRGAPTARNPPPNWPACGREALLGAGVLSAPTSV